MLVDLLDVLLDDLLDLDAFENRSPSMEFQLGLASSVLAQGVNYFESIVIHVEQILFQWSTTEGDHEVQDDRNHVTGLQFLQDCGVFCCVVYCLQEFKPGLGAVSDLEQIEEWIDGRLELDQDTGLLGARHPFNDAYTLNGLVVVGLEDGLQVDESPQQESLLADYVREVAQRDNLLAKEPVQYLNTPLVLLKVEQLLEWQQAGGHEDRDGDCFHGGVQDLVDDLGAQFVDPPLCWRYALEYFVEQADRGEIIDTFVVRLDQYQYELRLVFVLLVVQDLGKVGVVVYHLLVDYVAEILQDACVVSVLDQLSNIQVAHSVLGLVYVLKPRTRKKLRRPWSQVGFLLKTLQQQLFAFVGHFGQRWLCVLDDPQHSRVWQKLEVGRLTCKQLNYGAPQGPNIAASRNLSFVVYDLGSHPVGGAHHAECLVVTSQSHSASKVCQLDDPLLGKKYVSPLNISVDHSHLVQVIEPLYHLLDVHLDQVLVQ